MHANAVRPSKYMAHCTCASRLVFGVRRMSRQTTELQTNVTPVHVGNLIRRLHTVKCACIAVTHSNTQSLTEGVGARARLAIVAATLPSIAVVSAAATAAAMGDLQLLNSRTRVMHPSLLFCYRLFSLCSTAVIQTFIDTEYFTPNIDMNDEQTQINRRLVYTIKITIWFEYLVVYQIEYAIEVKKNASSTLTFNGCINIGVVFGLFTFTIIGIVESSSYRYSNE